jgi:hypothetical protein
MGPMTLLRLGTFGALSMAAVACTVDASTGPYYGAGGGGGTGQPCLTCDDAGDGGDAATVSAGSTTPSADPILGRVDDNVKMNASPGEGVGVFNEYDSGGQWHIWWTCDTNLTNENCPFDVKVSVATGAITNASSQSFGSGDTLTAPTPGAAAGAGDLEAKTTTTTGTQGIDFQTDPGATITLTATVGGLYNGKFLFWVENGKVNGGFQGSVTDPLLLVGASP